MREYNQFVESAEHHRYSTVPDTFGLGAAMVLCSLVIMTRKTVVSVKSRCFDCIFVAVLGCEVRSEGVWYW